MYLAPARFARSTHCSASNSTGSNWGASASYSATGTRAWYISHSASPPTSSPFHHPAGTE